MSGHAETLDLLFRNARSHNGWLAGDVPEETLRAAFELANCGPTSLNGQPMRVLFLRSEAAKERLRPALSRSNVDKTLTAPVVALLAHDLAFYERFEDLNPARANMAKVFADRPELAEVTAFRNATLQGAYFILAARAVGLDCGPMSGFDNEKVDAEFFAGTQVRSNFLVALGRGDPDKLPPPYRRMAFEEACEIL